MDDIIKTDNKQEIIVTHKVANVLPYIIVFFVLFLISLILITYVLGLFYKERQCGFNPNIWCSDEWVCANNCPSGFTGNSCFLNGTSEGLSSCIYGPTAYGATICYNPPSGTGSGTGGLACPCPVNLTNASNCLSNCGSDLSKQTGNGCCCKPGGKGCPYLTDNDLPGNCRGTN